MLPLLFQLVNIPENIHLLSLRARDHSSDDIAIRFVHIYERDQHKDMKYRLAVPTVLQISDLFGSQQQSSSNPELELQAIRRTSLSLNHGIKTYSIILMSNISPSLFRTTFFLPYIWYASFSLEIESDNFASTFVKRPHYQSIHDNKNKDKSTDLYLPSYPHFKSSSQSQNEKQNSGTEHIIIFPFFICNYLLTITITPYNRGRGRILI